jgi:transketolase
MELKKTANRVRINSLLSIYYAKSGHPGGSLSCADILTFLFLKEMRIEISDEKMLKDRFILSKGHAVPAFYSVALELGLINFDELKGFRKIDNKLQGHPDRKSTPWVEASTGSLGQGFSFAIGEALGFRHQKIDNRIYVLTGDGELQEGEIWEGAMYAGHNKLNNLCAIIDYNKLQSDDLNSNIVSLEPLADKWRAFNWNVIEIDGHNFSELEQAFKQAKHELNKPTVIIANTIKGKGVSFMEGSPLWHGSVALSDEDLITSLSELNLSIEQIKKHIDEK